MNQTMLQGCRALDLTDGESQLCGRILSDMGADVIRVERPGGDASRRVGPFEGDVIHPEKGLWWFVLNANKRGITLNLESRDGQEIFKGLVKDADFVIESFHTGHMARLGLDYAALSQVSPGLILTSITPFGQTGPYVDYKSSELVLMALGVFMFGTGDPDRPPVKPNYPLANINAAITAASASMLAHYHRRKTGRGQPVDVSAQAGPPWFTAMIGQFWQMTKREVHRTGPYNARRPDLNIRLFWPCKDGYVVFQFSGGVVGRRSCKGMAQWVVEAGLGDEYFKNLDWDKVDLLQASQAEIDRLEKPVGEFLLTRTRQELAAEAGGRGILMGYMDNMKDQFHNPQLASGWRDIEHPELGKSLPYPGCFVRSPMVNCGIRRRAPLIGEHNMEVYGELGISKEQVLVLNQAGVI